MKWSLGKLFIVASYISPEKVEAIIYSHQDPDVASGRRYGKFNFRVEQLWVEGDFWKDNVI